MKGNKGYACALSASLLALMWAGIAQAQAPNAEPSSGTQNPSGAGGFGGDIVVTAQKREQSINDVGMSISAIGGEALADRGITDPADMMKVVPGFTFQETAIGNPVYTLRGVGFIEQSYSSAPTVSVYVNEIPLPFAVMGRDVAFDLERLEVLKGPQGTLYGQNSTGGAFNYIAAKPTSQPETGLDLSYGRFGSFVGSGFASGPISENINVRLAVKTEQAGSWQKSYTRAAEHGATEKYAGRFSLDFQAGPATKISAMLTGWADRSESQAPQLKALFLQRPATASDNLLNYPLAPEGARFADWTPALDYRRDDNFWMASLRIDHELSNAITLTSISAYQSLDADSLMENDGMTLRNADRSIVAKLEAVSQELRVSGNHGPANWIVGANYGNYDTEEAAKFFLGDASNASLFDIPYSSPVAYSKNDIETYGIFANLEYALTDSLTLQGGIRYTETSRSYDGCGKDPGSGELAEIFSRLSGGFRGSPLPEPSQPGACYTLGPAPDFIPSAFVAKLKEDNISWRAGINWQVSPGSMIYANVSKGYKAGSFPTAAAAAHETYKAAVQEGLLAYEVGTKLALMGRALQFNLAGFYYDYKNKQLLGRVRDPIWGAIPQLVNIPKSKVMGIEAELTARPLDGLMLRAAGSYLDTEISRYEGINFIGENANFAGQRFPFASKYQFIGDASYEFPLNGDLDGFLGASYSYRSRTSSIFGDTTNVFDIDGYGLLDLSVGIGSSDGVWKATLWARNVTNEYYWLNVEKLQDVAIRYAGRPATYGFTIRIRP